jgi:hypothetical protein
MLALVDLPIPETGPDDARRTAEEVMADFTWGVEDGGEGLIQQIARAIGDLIDAMVGALFGSGILTVVAWVVIVGAIAALVVAIVRRRRSVPKRSKPVVRVTSLEASRLPHEWLSEAEALEARGEWKLGLRARYRSLVSELIHRRQLRDIPGRTTGEFRIELREHLPVVAEPFAAATDLFDRAWYGDRPTGAEEASEFQRRADEVLGKVPA